MRKLSELVRRFFVGMRIKSIKVGPIIFEPARHDDQTKDPISSAQIQSLETAVKTADPNSIMFLEVEIQLSKTWKEFLVWLNKQVPDFKVAYIAEDTNFNSSFYRSTKPGSLYWPIYLDGKQNNIPHRLKYDLVRDWLHPSAMRNAPPGAGLPWDASLFPIKDETGNEMMIDHPNVKLRDAVYTVMFASL